MFSNPKTSLPISVGEQKTSLHNPWQNLWFWLPILFACGQIIFITYQHLIAGHYQQYFWYFYASLVVAVFLCYLFYKISPFAFFFLLFGIFLLFGVIYCQFYHYRFLSYQKIDNLSFVNVSGQISAIKPSSNSNKVNVTIKNPVIEPYHYVKTVKTSKPKQPKSKKKHKIIKKSKKNKTISKKTKEKSKNKYPFTEKNILNNFINLKNYQEIDREFLDKNKKIDNLIWQKNNCQQISCQTLANPPPFVSINLVANDLAINDKIIVNAMFNARSHLDLPNSFDWQKQDLAKKIGGYAMAIGEIKIVDKAKIGNFQQYILGIREKINLAIKNNISNSNISAVVSALLIGNQEQIAENIMQDIRNSGLTHLLSISGFHLGLVAAMFFGFSRFLLATSQFLTIHYNIKKISAVVAVLASYIYLQLADMPLPAQRAFIVVFAVMLSYFINEKFHSKRALFLAFFLLILLNPYSLYNLGFQLSFLAIAVLVFYYSDLKPKIFRQNNIKIKTTKTNFWQNFYRFWQVFWQYFVDIVVISLLITFFSLPIIMNSVQNFSVLSFFANIFAIPLTSFVIMPLGVLALMIMPFGLEKTILMAMAKSIELFLFIANYVGNIKINDFAIAFIKTPYLPSFALLISLFGFLLFIIHQHKYLKIMAIFIFIGGLSVVFWQKIPTLTFLHNQKLILFYQQNSQELFFFGKFNNEKQQQNILSRFYVKQAISLPKCLNKSASNICWRDCDKDHCLLHYQDFTILLLKKNRHHLPSLCQKIQHEKINLLVNFSKKYALPSKNYCQTAKQFAQIDNLDFLTKGTHTFFVK